MNSSDKLNKAVTTKSDNLRNVVIEPPIGSGSGLHHDGETAANGQRTAYVCDECTNDVMDLIELS